MSYKNTLKIGMVAGEVSGDLLGAGLIRALKSTHHSVHIEGIAGPQMIAAGCVPLFAMEKLAVMGLIEIIKHLPEIIKIRHQIVRHFLLHPPDIFVGIDAPSFTLGIEKKLKRAGIRTVHYVSPKVWAWKQWRVRTIARAVDLMLTLFPFETEFYQKHHIATQFVGHPFADEIPMVVTELSARQELNLPPDRSIIALLPGSRSNEIDYLGKLFIQTAELCLQTQSNLYFVVPMVNEARYQQFKQLMRGIDFEKFPIQIVIGQSRKVMAAADVILLASGTATLEAMLLKKPMVVAYRMAEITYKIVRRMVKINYISLPNLLANKHLVPEYIQDQATPENLSQALLSYLDNTNCTEQVKQEFSNLHAQLKQNASQQAAQAIINLIKTDISITG